jgi:choline dehydrogenase-like flavoprotein
MADYDADVIVIGSGALGSLVAYEAAKAGRSVIILEAGPEIPDWKVTENWRTLPERYNWNAPFGDVPHAPNSQTPGYLELDNAPMKNFPGTLRVAGGTSRHWTASSWRPLPEDLKLKSTYGVGRDWSLEYAELEPFITEAEYLMGVNGVDVEDQSGGHQHGYPPRSKPFPLPPEAKPYMLQRMQMRLASKGYRVLHASSSRSSQPWNGRPGCIGNNMCQPNCPINAKYSGLMTLRMAQAAGAQLRTDAVVDKIEKGPDGKITAFSYLNPKGERTRLTAKQYVIAGHGIETPKLLLMNELANSSDQVGRNLMIHPGTGFTFYADEPLWQGRGQFISGAILERRNQPDRNRVAAMHYDILNLIWTDQFATELLTKDKLLGNDFEDALRDRLSRYVNIQTMTEDLARPENRISLNPAWKDSLGLPGLRLHYRLDDYSRATQANAIDDYANFLEALGGTPAAPPTDWTGQDHIMGTVIMGDDPKDSVVDANLRSYDHSNLFLVTTGVFPASGSVNPTLAGMALAIRAGRHIAAEV